MTTTDPGKLAARLTDELSARLTDADAALAARYPGDTASRQPIHTVYVPADRFHAGLIGEWGERAGAVLDEHADLFAQLTDDLDGALAARISAKLAREPIEDLRIDFEDGYGTRTDDAEDAHVAAAASALAASIAADQAAPFRGIRIKSLEAATRARAVATFVGFLTGLIDASAPLSDFVTTLPKVTSVDQVRAMVHLADRVERELSLTPGALRFEIQVETPQSILGPDGTALIAPMIGAAEGRLTALHYGTYDYSAFCGIAAQYQSMAHPVADHAKSIMQAAAAGTGVRLSDGSTNVLPIGRDEAVREGWALHLGLVRRSLERGFYQGWDLHPAQLPTRYAATIAFYRDGLAAAGGRLRNYLNRTTSAVLDEPATARALADYALRALHCGATDAAELTALSGASVGELTALARPGR